MNPKELMDELNQVAAKASNCQMCPLHKMRRNVVFSDGNPNTRLVLVGEGPGENEDATGKPFVGRAGALLDKALNENGLSRKDIYICNVVKCRPHIAENGRIRNRPPMPDEISACSSWLDAQLTLIKPEVILSLGSPSANAIIKKGFKITQERGIFFTSKWSKWAIATLHPAYILRQVGGPFDEMYKQLVGDIKMAWEKAKEAQAEPPNLSGEQLSLF